MIEKLKKYISENIIHFANIFGYEITARFCELLALVFEDIDEIVWNLMDLAEEFDGAYDGWGCNVVRE